MGPHQPSLERLTAPALLPLTGVSCLPRKVNRPLRKKRSRKFAAVIGGHSTGLLRAQGLGSEDAQDMVQEFFAALLRRQNFRTIRQEKGRLRSYLLVSLKRFLASERHQ